MERYTEDALMSDMILCLRELDSRAQPNTCRVLAKLATDYTKQLADAQAAVEALQRERDKLREATKVICGHCCEPMAIPSKAILQSQLSALQGLVRAYGEAKVAFDEGRLREDHHAWKERFNKLELAEAALIDYTMRTLDATTPAVCPDCDGDGVVDSGGTDPNGNPLMRRCGCREKGGDGE